MCVNSAYSQEPEADSLEPCSLASGPSATSNGMNEDSESLPPESVTESSLTPLSSAISKHSSVTGTPQAIRAWLMSLPEDSRVRTFHVPGGGKGIEGERSGLWKEMSQIIRIVGPCFAFVENSPMLTSRGLGIVLRDLAEMGFDARWGVFSASNVGRDIVRERIFIACASQEHGGFFPGWADQDGRNMVKHRPPGSPIDRYLEELDRQGEQRAAGGENSLPPYLCRVGDGVK